MQIRHHDLPESLLIRIQNIWFATRSFLSLSLEKTIENFQRDLQPDNEVVVWERIVSANHIAMDILKSDNKDLKKQVFRDYISFCMQI